MSGLTQCTGAGIGLPVRLRVVAVVFTATVVLLRLGDKIIVNRSDPAKRSSRRSCSTTATLTASATRQRATPTPSRIWCGPPASPAATRPCHRTELEMPGFSWWDGGTSTTCPTTYTPWATTSRRLHPLHAAEGGNFGIQYDDVTDDNHSKHEVCSQDKTIIASALEGRFEPGLGRAALRHYAPKTPCARAASRTSGPEPH